MFPKDMLILIADDSSTIRMKLRHELKSLGYEKIIEVENGEDAWTQLNEKESSSQPVGMIISDWNMPMLLGIELLKRVRAEPKWVRLPFLLFTTETATNDVLMATASGASGYLFKPLEPGSLAEKMEAVWKSLQKK
jgi:two-component system chemotaxis response regulator CheY